MLRGAGDDGATLPAPSINPVWRQRPTRKPNRHPDSGIRGQHEGLLGQDRRVPGHFGDLVGFSERINVLTGINGAGKSAVLDCIAILPVEIGRKLDKLFLAIEQGNLQKAKDILRKLKTKSELIPNSSRPTF